MNDQLWYLVDNDEDELVFLENAIESCALPVKVQSLFCAEDLYRQLEESIPDLLLLDIQLPGESGIECLAKLRRDKKFVNLSIIIISNQHYKVHASEALSAGARKYVIKPSLVRGYDEMVRLFYSAGPGSKENETDSFVLDFSADTWP